MLRTRFTELVGCTVPIQQAGMGAVSPPELAAAVAEAGGLGMIGTGRPGGRTVRGLGTLLERVRALTARPFGVNFLVAPVFLADMEPGCIALAARWARLVEFFYGWPDPGLVETVHAGGALACWQVGSREEARAAAEAGCDLVVAQGVAAGGHVRGTISTLVLLGEVLEVVDVPVLAAGGIGTGRAIAAALAAGASGARLGTRFVAAAEAGAHPVYIDKLIAARAEDTVYTDAFSVGWPNAPHRVLRSCVEAAAGSRDEVVGEVAGVDGTRVQVPRFEPEAVDRAATGAIEAMSLWAGESVSWVTRVQAAAEIIRELVAEAEEVLHGVGTQIAV